MRLYLILAPSVLGLAACAGGHSAARLDGNAAIGVSEPAAGDPGIVIRTEIPPAVLAEIVARGAPPATTGKTRLAALPLVTDAAPSAAAPIAGAAGGFDADTVDAAIDVLGAIIRAARSAPPVPPSGAVPLVSYTVRLDRGTTVEIAQPWHPGDQIVGPRERAAIRLVHGSREVVPEDDMLPAPGGTR